MRLKIRGEKKRRGRELSGSGGKEFGRGRHEEREVRGMKFEVATEWPEVKIVDLTGLVEVVYAPVLRFVFPVLEFGSE